MKPFLALILGIIGSLFGSCYSNELNRSKAFDLIKASHHYPDTLVWEISTGDPEAAKRCLDAGLEQGGWVTVMRAQRLMDMGKPWVTFSEKSKQFFLPTKDEDKKYLRQNVLTDQEDIIEVTGIKTLGKGKKAIVEYSTKFINLTLFAVLEKLDSIHTNTRKTYFSLYDDGWRIEKKPDMDFMVE